MNSLNVVILFAHYSLYLCTQILSSNFDYNFDSLDINLMIGQSERGELFDLNTEVDFTWVSVSFYTSEKDDTITFVGNESLIIAEQNMKAQHYQGNIQLENTDVTLSDMHYYYIPEIIYDAFDSFPLAYQFKNEAFSFIHQYYNKGIINERSFGFVFNPTYNGTFYIGGIPEEIKKSNPYSISCKVNNRYSTWNCDLTEVRFNGDVYRNDMPAIFQTNINTIAAPKKFYTYLMTNENAFKKEFDNKICEYHEEDEDNNFECLCSGLSKDISLLLIIGGNKFYFNYTQLFHESGKKCTFNIEINLKSINEWRLGYDFYKDYVSYFNYDKGEITLFRDKPFTQSNYLLVIIIFTIIVNILGLLNTAYYYIGYNKVYF